MTTITINIDAELNEKAQAIFTELRFDISTAVNMFLKQAVHHEGIPFEVKLKPKPRYLLDPDTSKVPVFGCMKDSIEIPPDFDEPLEELKEYMY